MCFSTVSQGGRFRFRFRFLENGSGGSGSAFGSRENGSDGSPFRFLGHPDFLEPLPEGPLRLSWRCREESYKGGQGLYSKMRPTISVPKVLRL